MHGMMPLNIDDVSCSSCIEMLGLQGFQLRMLCMP